MAKVIVDFIARFDKFNKGVDQAEKKSKSLSNTLKKVGVAAAAFIGVNFIKNLANATDQIGKFSTRLNVSTEALSELKFAAEQSGVGFNQLTLALQRSTRRIAEAAAGTGEAKAALEELGLSASELNKLSPDKQLEEIAGALEKVENQSDKVRLAFKLFDSEGVGILQTLEKGKQGLKDYREEARKLGLSFSEESVKGAEEFNDVLNKLSSVVKALLVPIFGTLAGVLNIILETVLTLKQQFTLLAQTITEAGNKVNNFLEKSVVGRGVLGVGRGIRKGADFAFTSTSRLLGFGGDEEQVASPLEGAPASQSFINQPGTGAKSDEGFDSELAKLEEQNARRLDSFAGFQEQVNDLLGKFGKTREDLTKKQQKKIKDLEDKDNAQKIEAEKQLFSELTEVAATFGKKGAAAAKALGIAKAIISTRTAITNALESAPVPLNFALAAAVAAKGFAEVAAIRSQKIPQFQAGGVSSRGGLALVGERGAELVDLPSGSRVFNNLQTRQIADNGNTGANMQQVDVNLTVDDEGIAQFIRAEINDINRGQI
jgi:uncharacterized protein Yka (UPF0111/DUF47 family)